MGKSTVTTAAFLAGATTLAVSLPVMAAERSFDLRDFEGVSVSSGLSAQVEVGPEFSVVAEARSNRTLNRLDIKVERGTLVVERTGSWSDYSLFSARRDATIHITLPVLKAIKATAGSDVYVDGASGDALRASLSSGADLEFENLDVRQVEFNASSGSDLTATGVCTALEAQSSSGSGIDASDLMCQTVTANASSGSDIQVHASESAVARASSGGDIEISGNPTQVEKHESSGGDVDLD